MNPPRNRKGEAGNPPSTTGALEFYPNKRSADEASKTGMKTLETGAFTLSREQHGRLPTYWPFGGPVYRRHDSYLGFRTELENRVGDAKGKGTSGDRTRPKVSMH